MALKKVPRSSASAKKSAQPQPDPLFGKIPPNAERRARTALQGLSTPEARVYVEQILRQAEYHVIESLPKLLGDIPRSQYPAFHAIDSIEEARQALRILLGGAS